MQEEAFSRRQFLRGGKRNAAAGIRPPGVLEAALSACTGCGNCREHCPTSIIDLEDGLPIVDFSRGECTFCGSCAEVCPEPVFTGNTSNGFDHIVAIDASCLPLHHVDCQACRDACPTDAIRFRPVRGGPFLPDLVVEACTGCGACISVCPVAAIAVATPSTEVAHA